VPRWRSGYAIACRAIPFRFESGSWLFFLTIFLPHLHKFLFFDFSFSLCFDWIIYAFSYFVYLSDCSELNGPHSIALAVQIPKNLLFFVILKRNSASKTRGDFLPVRIWILAFPLRTLSKNLYIIPYFLRIYRLPRWRSGYAIACRAIYSWFKSGSWLL
jgi:hypothetical protein